MPRLVRSATGGPAGGPYPSYASDGVNGVDSQFTPQIWSALMIEKFYPATVIGDIANTDYEGEIKGHGDSVVIRTTPDITITPYEVGMTLTYEVPESPSTILEIDKGLSFSFAIEDVDKVQSDIDLISDWTGDTSFGMATEVDREMFQNVPSQAAAENQGITAGAISGDINLGAAGAPVVLDRDNVLDWIVDIGTVMDEQNIPEDNRQLTLSAKICGLVKKSDLRDASLAGDDTSITRNGRLGMIDRFTLYHSNLLDIAGGEVNVMASHKSGLTFAAQMDEKYMVHMKNPSKHGELVRGLMVYGYRVVKPESVVWSVASVA